MTNQEPADAPATQQQLAQLNQMAQDAGEELPQDLTEAQAAQLIEQLEHREEHS